MTWLLPYVDLTQEQQRAVELKPEEHRVIFGAPGSGKTQILLHRAAHLRKQWNVDPQRLHIFVFTKVLESYIQPALDMLNIPRSCVSTLDAWCVQYHRQHIGAVHFREDDFGTVRRAVLEKLRSRLFRDILYDFVLVDEGQDLDGVSFEILTTISKHVTVCMDPKQRIYEQGSSELDILAKLGLKKRNMTLLDAFRCCPHIVHLASEFIEDAAERTQYTRQARTAQIEKDTPLLYCARDFEDEKRRLIEVVNTRQRKGDTVAVLFPQKKMVAGYAIGLREVSLSVETQRLRRDQADLLNFSTACPKLMTYHSVKGLTFDTVLMPRLTSGSFPDISREQLERLLFVGITRATKWVYMSTTSGKELPFLHRLISAGDSNHLTIQTAPAVHAVVSDRVQKEPAEDVEEEALDLL